MSLHIEQLENKIALSTLSNFGYRALGRKAHSTQPIVRQAIKPPLYVQVVPFNTFVQTPIISQISKAPLHQKIFTQTPMTPLVQTPMTPLVQNTNDLVQTPMTPLVQTINSNAEDNAKKQTNNGNEFPLFVMSITPSGAIHCVATFGKVLQRGA